SMLIVISSENVVDATGTTLKVTFEIQAVMQEDNPEQGWSAGDWVTGMAGYVDISVSDAPASDFIPAENVAALEYEEGNPTLIDILFSLLSD
ncbi:MAG: hypothetical protein J6Z34_06560, partial [Clostridia bacterium]|nr:hypothetical protein [Clostridia bacterium]